MKRILPPACFLIIALAMFISSCGRSADTKALNNGDTWEVAETTRLTGLTIAEGAAITAPEGYSVTLTVDGVEKGITPGNFTGNIALTLTEEMVQEYQGRTYRFRAAVTIENGKHVPEKSVAAAVTGGQVNDNAATDIRITSEGERFNGILATGDTSFSYTIDNPIIRMTGNGGSDFIGSGASILAEGSAEVTVNNADIINHGVVRSAAVVKDNATLHVNESRIETFSGALPPDVDEPWNGNNPYGMIAVPWMLGLTGNNRATNLLGNGTAHYTNSHIKAQAWGALSTDGCRDAKLYVTGSRIETVDSGYGAYADGAYDRFSNCTFDVTDYGLIMTGGTGIFTDGCEVKSGRFGVMFHGSADLTIDKGTVFNTKKAAIQVKSAYPTIVVDNATLNSENGLILQAMVNDDPNMMGGGMMPGGMPAGMPGGMTPDGGRQGGGPGGDAPGGPMPEGGMPGGGMPGGAPGGMHGGSGNTEATATFRNTTLAGDIVTSMTSKGDVIANLENATLTGAITTATAEPVGEPSYEKYYLIGEVVQTYCATGDEHGILASLDGTSTWVVDETSYLTGLTIVEGATVKAPEGHRLTMTVDGKETPVAPGAYEGDIVMTVSD